MNSRDKSLVTCRLSAILGERRITRAQVARDTGIARAVLDCWYNDKVSSYDDKVLGGLCRYLNVKPGDLLRLVEQGDLFGVAKVSGD
jgi:putative transcriptional regulator